MRLPILEFSRLVWDWFVVGCKDQCFLIVFLRGEDLARFFRRHLPGGGGLLGLLF
jgi:hypothetical protein